MEIETIVERLVGIGIPVEDAEAFVLKYPDEEYLEHQLNALLQVPLPVAVASFKTLLVHKWNLAKKFHEDKFLRENGLTREQHKRNGEIEKARKIAYENAQEEKCKKAWADLSYKDKSDKYFSKITPDLPDALKQSLAYDDFRKDWRKKHEPVILHAKL